mmetsp:Transcript_2428/g.3512  ORF Transcript_2428/g.3512 Transcript_2428/m.3512 type:complete len:211 (-) Transcript_2428:3018-3650(-)
MRMANVLRRLVVVQIGWEDMEAVATVVKAQAHMSHQVHMAPLRPCNRLLQVGQTQLELMLGTQKLEAARWKNHRHQAPRKTMHGIQAKMLRQAYPHTGHHRHLHLVVAMVDRAEYRPQLQWRPLQPPRFLQPLQHHLVVAIWTMMARPMVCSKVIKSKLLVGKTRVKLGCYVELMAMTLLSHWEQIRTMYGLSTLNTSRKISEFDETQNN